MKKTLLLFALTALCVPSLMHAHPHDENNPWLPEDHVEAPAVETTTQEADASKTYYRTRMQRLNTNKYLKRHAEDRAANWSHYQYNLGRCWVQVGDTYQHITGVDGEKLCRTNDHEMLENKINWVGKYDPALFEGQVYGRKAHQEPYKRRLSKGFWEGRNVYISHETGIAAKRRSHQMQTRHPEGRHADRDWTNSGDGDVPGFVKALRYRFLRK